MHRRWFVLKSFSLALILIFGYQTTQTLQAQNNTCPELVEVALASVDDLCSTLDRNSICYGNIQVDATFYTDVPDDFFTQPADIASILDVASVQTSGYTPDQPIWGVALMSIQADLPNTLPGQAVTILLLGDAEIQNSVTPDSAFVAGDPIVVTTVASASNIRALPNTSSFVIGSAPIGTTYETDARSSDGEWLRIIFDGSPAWLNIALVRIDSDISSLPIIETDQFTPMQAFTFNTGIGEPACSRAPDSILVQGPENIDVTINVNGADVTIGSTIVLKTPNDNSMQLLAVSGVAMIDGVIVPAGFTVSTELDGTGTAIPASQTGFRPLSETELDELGVLEDINADLLQYPISLPSRAEINRLQYTISNRENAIRLCSEANFTQEQCRQIISDDDLQNRFSRCIGLGFSADACRSIIGGDIAPATVARCLNEGFRTADACRDATQDETISEVEAFCGTLGATTVDECQELCEARGYDTVDACRTAFEESTGNQSNDQNSSGASSSPSPTQQQIANFCQSIGASSQSDCQQICNNNGYSTLEACWQGMG